MTTTTTTTTTTSILSDRGGSASGTARSVGKTVVALVILGVMLFPIYWMLNAAFSSGGNLAETSLWPTHLSLDGFRTAFDEQGRHLLNSFIVALGSMIISVVIAVPAAYALTQLRIRLGPAMLLVTLLTQMIPTVVVANGIYPLFVDAHLINSYLGLMLGCAVPGVPFSLILTRAFMEDFPREIIEAAGVDGSGPVRTFIFIVLPMARNAVVTSAIFSFLFAWSDFLMALTVTTNPAMKTLTLGIYDYIGTDTTDWSAVMATAVLSSIPAIAFLALAQRYISAGVASGSVK